MTPTVVAMGLIFLIVCVGTLVGLQASVGRTKNLEEWSVAGRSLGFVFVWLLMAGEIYTTFSFLGASGWAYSRGGPALYIMAYITWGMLSRSSFFPTYGNWDRSMVCKRNPIFLKDDTTASHCQSSPR